MGAIFMLTEIAMSGTRPYANDRLGLPPKRLLDIFQVLRIYFSNLWRRESMEEVTGAVLRKNRKNQCTLYRLVAFSLVVRSICGAQIVLRWRTQQPLTVENGGLTISLALSIVPHLRITHHSEDHPTTMKLPVYGSPTAMRHVLSRRKSNTLLAIALVADHEVRIAGSSSPCSLFFSGRIWARAR
jgi:hypothetical protein